MVEVEVKHKLDLLSQKQNTLASSSPYFFFLTIQYSTSNITSYQDHFTMDNLTDLKLSVNEGTGVATIQFNRPAKRNAFAQKTIDEMVATLAYLDSVDTVRAVVLTGGPEGHFCGKFLKISTTVGKPLHQ